MEGLLYWGCLKLLNISSTQRRHERYKIIYYHQIVNSLVPNHGLVLDTLDFRKGPLISGMRANTKYSGNVNSLIESSFLSSSPKLFIISPKMSVSMPVIVWRSSNLFLMHTCHLFLTLPSHQVWDPQMPHSMMVLHLTLYWPMFNPDFGMALYVVPSTYLNFEGLHLGPMQLLSS